MKERLSKYGEELTRRQDVPLKGEGKTKTLEA